MLCNKHRIEGYKIKYSLNILRNLLRGTNCTFHLKLILPLIVINKSIIQQKNFLPFVDANHFF